MKKGLIFDVDGVIIDVSLSYHYAIKNTAEKFSDHIMYFLSLFVFS